MNDIKALIESVTHDLSKHNLGFTRAQDASILKDSYIRTVIDIHKYVPLKDARILEIGAFFGIVSVALSRIGYKVTACDVPLVMNDPWLRSFLQNNNVAVSCFDLRNMPFPLPSSSYDVIIFCEVLEHLPFNPIPVISEFKRILSPHGICYVATPNLTSLVHRLMLLNGKSFYNPIQHLIMQLDPTSSMSVGLHWREYTKEELQSLFHYCGFVPVKHYYCRYCNYPSSSLRNLLVSIIYKLVPSFMQCQAGVFLVSDQINNKISKDNGQGKSL